MLMKVITFFKNYLQEINFFVPRKCFCFDYFCLNRRDKKNHNFLTHYQVAGRQLIEGKPLKKSFFDENLQRYCFNFSEHGAYYNFYDPRELVSDFLAVFENVFVPRPILDRLASSVHLQL